VGYGATANSTGLQHGAVVSVHTQFRPRAHDDPSGRYNHESFVSYLRIRCTLGVRYCAGTQATAAANLPASFSASALDSDSDSDSEDSNYDWRQAVSEKLCYGDGDGVT
jgi:hypothetical protein